ncbi:TPA: ead/Ea22-like family protein [Escherichia coli]|nr:ead/Ea22-like family protein [Escherichia coli]
MKQMSLIEMDGFLKGKCIPRDLKVNETNAEYLVRKFAEAEAKYAALAAENALARKAVQAFCDVVGDNTEVICEEVGRDGVLVILEAMKATGNMPVTDAFLAEVRVQGVEMAMEHMQSSGSLTFGDCYISLNEFAAQLRKGGNQ